MRELVAFLPIIVLMIASRILPRRLALLVSLGTAMATLVPWALGGSAKTFSLVLAGLIALSFVWTIAHAASAERWSGLMMTAGIALYALASIAAGHPFAEDWAHDRVAPALWQHPLTVHITTAITAVWGAIYLVLAILAYPRERWTVSPRIRSTISLVLVLGGILMSSWYPAYAVAAARG
jgi:hypothetical protein